MRLQLVSMGHPERCILQHQQSNQGDQNIFFSTQKTPLAVEEGSAVR